MHSVSQEKRPSTNMDNANDPKDEINSEKIKMRETRRKSKQEAAKLNHIITLLQIDKDFKTNSDIKDLKEYLTSHYDYFRNLSRQSEDRFLKLIPLLKYESFKENERIMNFGDEGDKCYILLKGTVGIYKPFPVTKSMTLRKYVEYLEKVKNEEQNKSKFERLLNYNSKIDKNQLYLIDFDYNKLPKYSLPLDIVLEEERELAKGKDGISFGEMALIKNEPRNATIIALEPCSLISIEKSDYNKILKDLEELRIIKELSTFKGKYPIFKFWHSGKCFPLISGLITQELMKDEYVYKQNDFPDYIYLMKEGVFEVSSYYNFDTYERFIEYIHDTTYSLIPYIDNIMEWKEDKISKRVDLAFQKNLSPFIIDLDLEDKVTLSHKEEQVNSNKEDIAKNLEGELNKNKKLVFKTKISNLYSPDIFGFVEALELKQRLTNVRCISHKGVVLKFPSREFLQILPTDKRNNFVLQQRIFEEKKYLMAQLKNNALGKLNFVKINIDKNLYIKKDFFLNKSRKNSLDFKKIKLNKDLESLAPINLYKKYRLTKNNSSIFNNNSKANNISKFTSNESFTTCEENNSKNNKFPFDLSQRRSNNLIINGFKNSLMTLTRHKINSLKNMYPTIEPKLKQSISTINIKDIENHSDNYVKYLENNLQYVKTPTNLRNKEMFDLKLMTGKRYISLEAEKIINKINKNNKMMRKITVETREYNGLFLPSIKLNQEINRNSKKNKSDIVKVKKIQFKTVNI